MKHFIAAIPITFTLFVFSCNNDNNPLIDLEKQKELIPLHVGNTWEYTITLYDSVGNVKNSSTEYRQIISDTLVEGERWYRSNFFGYIANRSDGIWQRNLRYPYIGESQELGEPFLRIPFPLEINESITINSMTYTLLDKEIKVTVPAGTFSCYLYRLDYPPVLGGVREYFLYYSPGVGLIKERWDLDYEPSPYPIISYYAGEWVLKEFQVH